jgi:hypothetical protein
MQNDIIYNELKITNPVNRPNTNIYNGDINNYPFNAHHATQLQQIQQTLPDALKLKKIFVSTFVRNNNTTFLEFVACSDGNRFIWRKYDCPTCVGGSQNWVYLLGDRYKTTTWLNNYNNLLNNINN